MKKALVVFVLMAASTAMAGWNSFVIRNPSTGITIDNTDPVYGTTWEFLITRSGMKGGLGTDCLDGRTIGDIGKASIERLDNYTRFTAGTGPSVAPYFNIWITDGTNFAVVANEPSNAEWSGLQWDFTWDDLKNKTLKVYENSDKTWLPNKGVGLKFEDIAGFEILAPSAAQLTAGWTGLGLGAPRELGTNQAYGFTWVFGDTLSNYVSGDPGYKVANPSVTCVPAPGALLLGSMGLGLVGWLRRKRSL